MRSILFSLLILILLGCEPREQEDSLENNTPSSPSSSRNITRPPPRENTTTPSQPSQETKRLEAIGFGIFNYSELTPSTCDPFFASYQDRIIQKREDIERLEDRSKDHAYRVEQAAEELAEAQASGNNNAIDRKERNLENEEDELEIINEEIEDEEDTLKKHIIIKETIEKECVKLKVKVGKID